MTSWNSHTLAVIIFWITERPHWASKLARWWITNNRKIHNIFGNLQRDWKKRKTRFFEDFWWSPFKSFLNALSIFLGVYENENSDLELVFGAYFLNIFSMKIFLIFIIPWNSINWRSVNIRPSLVLKISNNFCFKVQF